MAETETTSVTVSDHQAHPDEPAQKKVEDMQNTKQEDVTQSRDAKNNGDIEKPKSESNGGPEAPKTKLEELPNSKLPEASKTTEVEKDQGKNPPEAESTEQEIPFQVEKCPSELQGLTDEAAERKMEEATITDDGTKGLGEKLVTEERTPIEEVAKEEIKIPADVKIEELPGKTSASETIKKVPEDTPVSEGHKIVVEENTIVESVQSTINEKPTNDTITKDKPVESELAAKRSVEPNESIQEKMATEAAKNATEEITSIEVAAKEQVEIPTDATTKKEQVERVSQEKPASEEVKNVVEGKPAAEEVKIVTEEKPTDEVIKSANDEKPTNEANESKMKENSDIRSSGNVEELKPDAEAVSTVVEKEIGSAPAEKPTVEPIKSIQDEPAAFEKTDNVTEKKATIGGDRKDQPATEGLDKPESEKAAEKTNVFPGESMDIKERKTPEESKDNMVSSEEKVDTGSEPMVVKNTSVTTEEAQPDQKKEEKPAVSGGNKSLIEVTTEEAARADVTEQSLKTEAKLPEKVEQRKEESDLIEEDKDKKTFRLGDLMQEDTNETENAGSSETTQKDAKKSWGRVQPSRDIEVSKEKAESVVEAAPTSADSCKEKDETAEGSKVTTLEVKNYPSEVKTEEKVEADANKSETEKESKDEKKLDSNTTRDSSEKDDNGKESQDLSTKQVSGKPANKQSNNILSKVKKSIVKIKKALIRKTPSSRNISTEA